MQKKDHKQRSLEEIAGMMTERLASVYEKADEASNGVLSIVRRTIKQITDKRVSQAAASIAYYALFSLFPLLMFLIVVVSFFLEEEQAIAVVLDTAGQVLLDVEGIQDLTNNTIGTIFNLRGEIGIFSLLGLLWSASAAFTTLAYNIDLAWAHEQTRPALQQRLVGIIMILILGAGLLLTLIFSAILNVVLTAGSPLWRLLGLEGGFFLMAGSRAFPWLLTFLAILALYRWAPKSPVSWSSAGLAAFLASLAWQVANAGFVWYLGSGFARYELLYGSLTTVIVLMFWMYLIMMILLTGSHLSASITQWQRERLARQERVIA